MAWTGVQLVSADLRAGRIAADDPAQPGGDR
jgi:hypothetical protein